MCTYMVGLDEVFFVVGQHSLELAFNILDTSIQLGQYFIGAAVIILVSFEA